MKRVLYEVKTADEIGITINKKIRIFAFNFMAIILSTKLQLDLSGKGELLSGYLMTQTIQKHCKNYLFVPFLKFFTQNEIA